MVKDITVQLPFYFVRCLTGKPNPSGSIYLQDIIRSDNIQHNGLRSFAVIRVMLKNTFILENELM